ncbi:amino acid ABC transporter permease [Rhizobium puerariae]|uniref:Amino acid ABC transporter permease n=1 Tax=Rhizobium puerariae TaxID=1585791 RepID=A0ABV6ADZ3_9HYPH
MGAWDRFVFTFFNADIASRYWPMILDGLWVTILAGLAVVVTGIVAGMLLASLRTLGVRAIDIPIIFFVDIFRALPPLAIILVIFFGLPNVGIVLPSLVVLWISLGLVLAAFSEEVFWAGITSVPPGQWMAAQSTGMTFGQTLFSVILPQAVRLAIPPLTNRTISITKNLALGSAIGVNEILGQANSALSMSSNATPLTMGAFLYVLVFAPLIVASRLLERRYQWGGH